MQGAALVAISVAISWGQGSCGGGANTPAADRGGVSDGAVDGPAVDTGGAGGRNGGAAGTGVGGAAGNATGGDSGADGGATGGAAGGTGGAAGTDGGVGAGPDLSNCPIRGCLERFRALQAGCSGFDVACVHERYGTQHNYCMANGVRMYFDNDGVVGLATIIKPDGRTCYTIDLTYASTGATTGVVKDPEGTVIFTEVEPAEGASTFRCDSTSWIASDERCGVVNSLPYTACPDSAAGTCRRP
jgi:hypothetical protein